MAAKKRAKVNLYTEKVVAVVEGATLEAMAALALQVQGQAEVNIQTNDQVDTGFMINSVYTVSPQGSGYAAAQAKALAKNSAGQMAPQVQLTPAAAAAIVAGAEYAIYQEMDRSFLYRALEMVAPKAGATIERVAKPLIKD
jgi:hypothetical protein